MSDDVNNPEDELDRGFNDQELEDIMSEIENLESEYAGDNEVLETPKNEIEAEVAADSREEDSPAPSAGDNDIMDAVENELEADEGPEVSADSADNVVPMARSHSSTSATSAAGAETQLDFTISGQMKMHLNFHLGGQQVGLTVDENEGLVIQMPGGAKFTIPVNSDNVHKKSA